MGNIGALEITLIILVLVLLFGAKKLPELARVVAVPDGAGPGWWHGRLLGAGRGHRDERRGEYATS